uniref:Photosystem II extrinsic protein V n=1 Tax=Spyridia filamentosa TaxID=196632 RepID=A0A1Z1MJN8_SPYFI|nr:photosystem II cytochrome c550 [Spyridia filamentosa]ARW66109.1 photosystem II cytochrome c550 [Spyridia filamentosa]
MLKKNTVLFFLVFIFLYECFLCSVKSIELDDITRTVQLDDSGEQVVLTAKQIYRGKRLFNNSCAQCHNGGITKTNPNVGLDLETLSLATPSRDSVLNLVDYMKDPTDYDGQYYIFERHPSIKSANIFPKMRNLTDEDLFAIAGHILVQAKTDSTRWGGGKIYY